MKHFARYMLTRSSVGRLAAPLLRNTYERRIWARSMNLFSGVFPTYAAAVSHNPRSADVGWNDEGIAKVLVGDETPRRRHERRDDLPILLEQPSTFAVMLWLGKLVKPGTSIVDVGGASGLSYWHFRDYFDLPDETKWTVVDVPEMASRGKALAQRTGALGLEFTDRIESISNCDVLISLGCLQYMSPDAFNRFVDLAARAQTVIINKMPLIDGPDFWTLQSLGSTSGTYWIANRDAFVRRFQAVGLEIADAWTVPELTIDIPFAPERHVGSLRGLVLKRNRPHGG